MKQYSQFAFNVLTFTNFLVLSPSLKAVFLSVYRKMHVLDDCPIATCKFGVFYVI